MEKIFLYRRVSTDLQVEKNTQNNQKKAALDYLQFLKVEVVDEFEDLAQSGASKNREQFNRMISRLDEVNGILVFDLDRLVRDLEIGLELMQILMQKHIKIYESRTKSVKDLLSDNDQLLYFLGIWFAANERKKIRARLKLGIERHIREKGHWGPKIKQINLQKYLELREMGISKNTIAKIFKMSHQTLLTRLDEKKIPKDEQPVHLKKRVLKNNV